MKALGGYMSKKPQRYKNTKEIIFLQRYNFFKFFFLITPLGAIRWDAQSDGLCSDPAGSELYTTWK